MGPCIVTADEFGDPSGHRSSLSVNGEIRQDSDTRDLLFSIADIIASLSASLTLEPGDVIATGTPSGVALGMVPQRWLQVSDVVEAKIDGSGMLLTTWSIVLLDDCDNCASGGTMDSMTVLGAVLDAGLENVAAFAIYAPAAVEEMTRAGVGADVTILLGGKFDMPSIGAKGTPRRVAGRVKRLSDGRFRNEGPMSTGQAMNMGRCDLTPCISAADDLKIWVRDEPGGGYEEGKVQRAADH